MGCADTTCPDCNGICNTEQSLCTILSQQATAYGGVFSWPVPLAAPPNSPPIVRVWTAAAWNQLRGAVNSAFIAGAHCSSQGESFGPNTMPTVTQHQPITAEIYNNMRNAVNNFGGGIPQVTGGEAGTIIRHYHASLMASTYNGGQIYQRACNTCNVGCNVECDGCVGCVTCEGVLHYSTCYGSD